MDKLIEIAWRLIYEGSGARFQLETMLLSGALSDPTKEKKRQTSFIVWQKFSENWVGKGGVLSLLSLVCVCSFFLSCPTLFGEFSLFPRDSDLETIFRASILVKNPDFLYFCSCPFQMKLTKIRMRCEIYFHPVGVALQLLCQFFPST